MNAGIDSMNEHTLLTNIEMDTIGEIMNISMGAAATAVSVLLNKKVNITTPVVQVIEKEQFEYKQLEPAIGVEINYIEGLHGSNLMIMNITDVKAIVAAMLGETEVSAETGLDEIHLSALGEIMNQMMGSSSTALASFLNKSINISPPSILEPSKFYKEFFENENGMNIVTIAFRFVVEGLVDNQFVTVLPVEFTKELVSGAMSLNGPAADERDDYQDNITGHKQIPNTVYADEPPVLQQETVPQIRRQQVKKDLSSLKPQANANVNVKAIQFENFDEDEDNNGAPGQMNLDLVMDVELNVTVEIGHAKKPVKEVLNMAKGSLIELDRKSGDPVDIVVNGQLIAKGDVVVIDDNFGVRITKLIGNKL